jgi:glucose/arabinose dehydrogenase
VVLAALAQQKSPPVTIQDQRISNTVEVAAQETTPQRIANLKLPAGFTITKFAEMYNPRMIVVAPNGTIYISQRESGTLVMLKDTNRDGRADVQKVVATRKFLHGMAIRDNTMFFMTIRELYRAPIKPDGTLGQITLVDNTFPDAGQHPNRTMKFGPDGKLYISVGSQPTPPTSRTKKTPPCLWPTPTGATAKSSRRVAQHHRLSAGTRQPSALSAGITASTRWAMTNRKKRSTN